VSDEMPTKETEMTEPVVLTPTPAAFMERGVPVARLNGPRSTTIEAWVQQLVASTGIAIDWRLMGGWAVVLVLRDEDALPARSSIEASWGDLIAAYQQCPDNFGNPPFKAEHVIRRWYVGEGADA
jgi:hypothetical protein